MRFQFLGYSLVLAATTIGCGGDDGPSVKIPDAKVFMDAPPNQGPTCLVVCEAHICDGMNGRPQPGSSMFPALILADGRDQQTGDPLPIEEEVVFTVDNAMSKFNGRTLIEVAGTTSPMGAALADLMIIQVVKPTNGAFPTNTAINFETDPNAAVPTGVMANAFILGDINPQSETISQFLWASSGSVTLTEAGELEGDLITGEMSAATFREVDGATGEDVANGCMLSFGGLAFHFQQTTAMTFQDSKKFAGPFRSLTSEERELARRVLKTIGR